MQLHALLNFLSIAATSLSLVTATPIEPLDGTRLNVITDPLPAGITPSLTTKCASLITGQSVNDTSVVWEDCPTVVARHEEFEAEYNANQKRGIICKKRNGCQPPCYVSNSRSISLLSSGTWSTRWCHLGGLRTMNKGSIAWMSTGHSTSVTWSGSVGLGGPVGDYLDASLGYQVTRTKSIQQGVGCVNTDGKAHGVWGQERMGWANSGVTDTTKYTGGGCEKSGTYTSYNTVHADFPDPHRSGYRDLLAGCGSPDDATGPWCNLDAPSLNAN